MDITVRKTLIIIGILLLLAVIPAMATEMKISVDTRCVQPSSDISIPVSLSEVPGGLSGMNVTVALSDPEVAQIVDIKAPAWASLTKISSLPGQQGWIKAVDTQNKVNVNDRNVPLGTVSVRGLKKGNVILTITSTRIDDDQGSRISVPVKSQQLCFGDPSGTIPATSSLAQGTSGTTTSPKTTYSPLPGIIPVVSCIFAGVFMYRVTGTGRK